jgi:hypothetical protein
LAVGFAALVCFGLFALKRLHQFRGLDLIAHAFVLASLCDRRELKTRKRRSPSPDRFERDLLLGLDWRTREGRFLTAARRQLTAHVGGNPNNVEKALIERAAMLSLYVERLDAEALAPASLSGARWRARATVWRRKSRRKAHPSLNEARRRRAQRLKRMKGDGADIGDDCLDAAAWDSPDEGELPFS